MWLFLRKIWKLKFTFTYQLNFIALRRIHPWAREALRNKPKANHFCNLSTCLVSNTVACKETRCLGIFSTKKFELLKSCPTLTLLPPNKRRLEVSKNVQYVSVAQWAAKLQLVKLEVIFHKVWWCTTLQPFELQRRTAPFWKPPNPLYLEQNR